MFQIGDRRVLSAEVQQEISSSTKNPGALGKARPAGEGD